MEKTEPGRVARTGKTKKNGRSQHEWFVPKKDFSKNNSSKEHGLGFKKPIAQLQTATVLKK
jgi:hypothetical protein